MDLRAPDALPIFWRRPARGGGAQRDPGMAMAAGVGVATRVAVPVIVAAGCLVSMLTFGPRSAAGFFQLPIIEANGWGRDMFSVGIAVQNLFWGLGQPFAGAITDRYGTLRVLCAGALLYAAGLVLMAFSTTPSAFTITAGVMIGLGLSGCALNVVLAAFGKLLPPENRSMAFGLGTAAGSFGQVLFSPLSVGLIAGVGWQETLILYGAAMLLVLPLSMALATRGNRGRPDSAAAAREAATPTLGVFATIAEAFGHRSYVLLVLGFFTCGFQLAFITAHLPAYLSDVGVTTFGAIGAMELSVGATAFLLVGLFNIVGSLAAGWLGQTMPRRYILAGIYFGRAVATLIFILLPPSPLTAILFAAVTGLLWLSTVPPTSSLVAIMFGVRNMAMLYGFAFFSHQVGGFLGVLLGGILYESTGSYMAVWWLSIALGVASALINLPIVEKPVPRLARA
jgi:MFS family permease